MNLTILAFVTSLAIYGISSLAMPRPWTEQVDDFDIALDDAGGAGGGEISEAPGAFQPPAG